MPDPSGGGEKTEEGSEKKVRDALEQGNTPVSREATVFCSMAAMLLIASLVVAHRVGALVDTLVELFGSPARAPFATTADTVFVFSMVGRAAGTFLLPIVVMLMLAGLGASLAQGMPRLVGERIRPKWSKVSPVAGLKRIAGRDGQVEFAKSLAKFAIVGIVAGIVLRGEGERLIETLYLDPATLGSLMLAMGGRLLAGALVAFALLSATDLLWSRHKWRRDLRMTKQEVKDELKQAEGDPYYKAKRRSLALDRSRRRMMGNVPRATLVIANPTHYAIAIRYVREEGGAPIVLAKGQDLIALRIRAIAEGHAIPVIEDKALARSMYDHVQVSQLIPAEFYKAVAELIHFLQSREKPRARSSSIGV